MFSLLLKSPLAPYVLGALGAVVLLMGVSLWWQRSTIDGLRGDLTQCQAQVAVLQADLDGAKGSIERQNRAVTDLAAKGEQARVKADLAAAEAVRLRQASQARQTRFAAAKVPTECLAAVSWAVGQVPALVEGW